MSVVEYVLANALILLRGAYQAGPRMMAGEWPRTESSGREVSGRILGLMPHPERHIDTTHHPRWTRGEEGGSGMCVFKNAVRYFVD